MMEDPIDLDKFLGLDKEPEAVIERRGKYWFNVYIRHGILTHGPYGVGWSRLGYERAYKKGQKELKKFNKKRNYRKEVTVIK